MLTPLFELAIVLSWPFSKGAQGHVDSLPALKGMRGTNTLVPGLAIQGVH